VLAEKRMLFSNRNVCGYKISFGGDLVIKKSKLLIGLTAITLLSACSTEKTQPTGAAAGQSGAPSTDQGTAPAELVIFSSSGWTQEAFNEKFGDSIRKKFPQHTIKYIQSAPGSTYQELITAGQQIDIIWESIALFTNSLQFNIQTDMSNLIKKHSIDISKVDPTMLEAIKVMTDGKQYVLPVLNNTLSLYYNKDIFDKFAIPYPKDGITWDEVYDLNKKLTRADSGAKFVGLSISTGHYFDVNPLSAGKVDPKTLMPTINNDKWKTLLGTFTRAAEASGYKEKVQEQKGIPGVNNFVKTRDAAMFAGLANTHMTQDVSQLNWDVVSYPTFKEAPGVRPQSYPTYYGVTSNSKYQDQGMQIIKYLLSEEYQLWVSRSGTLPVVKTDAVIKEFAQDTKFKDKNVKSALYSSFAPISPKTRFDAPVSTAVTSKLVDLTLGNIDVNTLLRTAEEEGVKGIEALKAK
jgi:ABC-type glycerol-3-phosphate transport system substrate-binding protein